MLTEPERREIAELIGQYETTRAVIPEALQVVQRQRGWVSDDAITEVAGVLELTPDEVDSIATFYNLIFRRPVGRHMLLVCNSVSCWIMGYPSLRDYLTAKLGIALGETTADGRFTLLPTVCLGACDHAPAMLLDDELYGDLTPEKIDEILAQYL